MNTYSDLKRRLARGWNTWNTRSVLSHVRLPDGLALNLGVKNYAGARDLWEIQVDRDGAARPGGHAWDGSYTELTVRVPGGTALTLKVETAHAGEDLVVLVTPEANAHKRTPLLLCAVGLLWNRPGDVRQTADGIVARTPARETGVYATRAGVAEPNVPYLTPYLALPLEGVVGISTGRPRGVEEIAEIVAGQRAAHGGRLAAYGAHAEVYEAIQSCMAWDTIYEPGKDRVVSTVSRIWNCGRGGWALFCWDTYFGALLAGVDHKDLAYANAIEITREHVEAEYAGGLLFVPNVAQATGRKHRDHSQPPVGAMTVELLYRKFQERWLLEEVFDDLLAWNRWWDRSRREGELLCWGSNPYVPVVGEEAERIQAGKLLGAILESGLDNSPMYDDVPYDAQTHLMQMNDVGLNGLYVADCASLARMAEVLGRPEAAELHERRAAQAAALGKLWDEGTGLFLNRRTDTGAFNRRVSPTNFYACFEHVASDGQAERMLRDHLLNPEVFNTPYVLPATPRNDPAFGDQSYWRGRVWAPLNFLVYLALRNYGTPAAVEARGRLAGSAAELLLGEWRSRRHVHENYHPLTGEGCDKENSDPFYHWGGLLGLIALMEAGVWDAGAGGAARPPAVR